MIKHKSIPVLIVIVFLLCILFLMGAVAFRRLGMWLVVADPVPAQVDLIFTFAGEIERVSYSKALMKKYPDAHWLLSDYKNGYSRILRQNGFNMKRVSTIDTCSNTLAEVRALYDWINSDNNTINKDSLSVGLISSAYHMRRINMMIQNKFLGENAVHFHYLPVPFDSSRLSKEMFKTWWKSGKVKPHVISELQKIVFYMIIS